MTEKNFMDRKVRMHVNLSNNAAAMLEEVTDTGFNFSAWVEDMVLTHLGTPTFYKEKYHKSLKETEKLKEIYEEKKATWVDPRTIHVKDNIKWWENGLQWLEKDVPDMDYTMKNEVLFRRFKSTFPSERCSLSQWPARLKFAQDFIKSYNDVV